MIDDGHRGYLMELMATKLLSMQRGVQIIGMSATLSVSSIYERINENELKRAEYKGPCSLAGRQIL